MALITYISIHAPSRERHDFNKLIGNANGISIHAPSRERRYFDISHNVVKPFQSTLPRGSDKIVNAGGYDVDISIHAPSRERLRLTTGLFGVSTFQSTLPRGSDRPGYVYLHSRIEHFNPRSLAGATGY